MKQITIEISSDRAMKLIKNLEELQIIRVLKSKPQTNRSKLSKRLVGSLTKAQASKLDRELKNSRSEWERTI